MSKANTLSNEGNENIIVYNSAYSPLYLFNKRKSLLTLRTLRTLAN